MSSPTYRTSFVQSDPPLVVLQTVIDLDETEPASAVQGTPFRSRGQRLLRPVVSPIWTRIRYCTAASANHRSSPIQVVLRAPWRPSSYNAPSGSRRSRTADSGDGGFLVTIKGDRMSNAEFKQFLEATFRSYRSVVKPGASMYVCHSSSWQREFQNALESADFEVRCRIIWAKNTFAWVSVVTSSSTSRCSTVTSQARRTPGTATRPSRRCGARKSLRRTASTQPPNQQS